MKAANIPSPEREQMSEDNDRRVLDAWRLERERGIEEEGSEADQGRNS